MADEHDEDSPFWRPSTVEYTLKLPCPVPDEESAFIYVGPESELSVLIALSDIDQDDIEAFEAANVPYGLFTQKKNFPVALLLYKFPEPLGEIDLPFNIEIEPPPIRIGYLERPQKDVFFYLMDFETKAVESAIVRSLDPRCTRALHETALEQLKFSHEKKPYSFEIELQIANTDFPTFDDLWNNSTRY